MFVLLLIIIIIIIIIMVMVVLWRDHDDATTTDWRNTSNGFLQTEIFIEPFQIDTWKYLSQQFTHPDCDSKAR